MPTQFDRLVTSLNQIFDLSVLLDFESSSNSALGQDLNKLSKQMASAAQIWADDLYKRYRSVLVDNVEPVLNDNEKKYLERNVLSQLQFYAEFIKNHQNITKNLANAINIENIINDFNNYVKTHSALIQEIKANSESSYTSMSSLLDSLSG